MKLFIQENDNDPACFDGMSLTDCISKALCVMTVHDQSCDESLPDVLDVFRKLAENLNDHQWEGDSSVAAASGMSCMMDLIVMCYGYDTWEEFEKDQEKLSDLLGDE